MYYIAKYIQSWREFETVASNFLKSGESSLFIGGDLDLQEKIESFDAELLPDLDLVQFCNLRLLEKGELGIREIHWKVSDVLTGSKTIYLLLSFFSKIPFKYVHKYEARFTSMRVRRNSLVSIMRIFNMIGMAIPHYIEPRNTSVVMSRTYVHELLEFNSKGILSFERAFFALARTANYKCVRITRDS